MGKAAAPGIARGIAYEFSPGEIRVDPSPAADPKAELERFERGRETAAKQLTELYNRALETAGQEEAAIFDIHRMMLEDQDFVQSITDAIGDGVSAAYGAQQAGQALSAAFAAMEDPYLRERAADIRDVTSRLVRILCGKSESSIEADGPVIVIADDLSPSQTVQMDKSKVLAFVTRGGSPNSHTAILARTLGIPAVVGVGEGLPSCHGQELIVDGVSGLVYLSPEDEAVEQYRQQTAALARKKAELEVWKSLPTRTRSGRIVEICANIGGPEDLPAALENGAEGIGLFRSEFLFLGREAPPTEEEQLAAYKEAALAMGDRRVIIRTLDIGADKQAPYLDLPPEENPALGLRGLRLCLSRPALFQTQLRALYRASAHGNVAVMFPMVNSLRDVREAKAAAALARESLAREDIPHNPDLPLGIMIETPAAALISAELAAEVDFFSVGTNDLTQYTLAVDRQHGGLDRFLDPHHPALFRLLEACVQSAHRQGIWIGICGELAADLSATQRLVEMGMDEFSLSARGIPALREAISRFG
ncbi:phosphoenolpyruvate--protein phosphotransferase [Bacteroides sp. OttesenSCG-928-J23]|nr:phosphoenolpyruvate--protein phosphotransferase [Bacteroides sp. OttesenSCG-928-J23]